MIGETVYHYRILDKIGEGGMGVVYRAEDINLRRTVALKFLSPISVQHGTTREHVMKEARAAASLDHQNICAIHEVEELDDKLFIVMAYCKGRTLGTIIRDDRPGVRDSLDILIQITDGLGAAHEAGIIHRDIKPANVIVSDNGRVKIMDFGLAKRSGTETMSMTMAGAGTLAYMSPEQVRGDHVDTRSDIWSLGVLMYQLFTGRRPFEGEYDASILYNIVNEPHLPATEVDPDIPPHIAATIEKSLEKNPDDRYQSMEELRKDLVEIRDELFGKPETEATRKHILSHQLKSILAFAVSIVLVLFIIRYVIMIPNSSSIEETGVQSAVPGDDQLSQAQIESSVLYKSGFDLYYSGNQPKGIPIIEEALRIDPDNLKALKTLATFYDWGGDYKRAAEYIQRAKELAHENGPTEEYVKCTYIEAKVLHNWDLAMKLSRDFYKANPDAVTTHIEIGYILSRYIGDNKAALEQYALFFKEDPDNESGRHAQAYNYTGTARLYSGVFDKAIEAFTRYQDMHPDSPDPVSSIAGAYFFAGDYDKAYNLYSSLLQRNTPAFTAHEGLGRICSSTGRLRESNEHFHRYLGAVICKGQKVHGHIQLAINYLTKKDLDSFDREMRAIDLIDPQAAQACWLRGVRYITVDKDVDKARTEFIRLKDIMEQPFVFEETSRCEHLRGLILLAEGRTQGAIEALQEAVLRSPRDFFYFGKEYARVLLEIGEADQALSKCLELTAFNPNDPMLLMTICRANRQNGDVASAKDCYDRTLDVLRKADEDFLPLIEFKAEFMNDPDI